MIYDTTNETHDKYVQALKKLDEHHTFSEHTKVPETREEIAFMHETNAVRFSKCFGLNIPEDRFNAIFGEK